MIVSFSKSKLEWYDAPIYPLLALLIAIGLESIYLAFSKLLPSYASFRLLLFCIAIFGMPYKAIILTIYLPTHTASMNRYADFIKQIPEHKSYALVDSEYNGQLLFYEKLYAKKAYDLPQKYPRHLKVGEKAMICGEKVRDTMNILYQYDTIESWQDCRLILISQDKNADQE